MSIKGYLAFFAVEKFLISVVLQNAVKKCI